jgi:hypothetical protein
MTKIEMEICKGRYLNKFNNSFVEYNKQFYFVYKMKYLKEVTFTVLTILSLDTVNNSMSYAFKLID